MAYRVGRRGWLLGCGVLLAGAAAEGETAIALHTPLGVIICSLALRRAPLSAGAFLGCVQAGAYQDGHFTRVVRPDNDHGRPVISVVQGAARPGHYPSVAHESTRVTGLRHRDGTLSLPRDTPGSATGGEFFICIGDQPALDLGAMRNKDGQGFAAFGRVTQGMDIVRRIWTMPAEGASPDAYTRGQMLTTPVPITTG